MEKVRLGLYGTGNRTRALLDAMRLDDVYEVVAAHDLSAESARSAVDTYGGVVCDSADALVAHADVDAFLISLDPFAHPDAFYRVLEARKPIFIEKPVAPTAGESRRMQRAAEEAGVPVQVGFMRRYKKKHRDARQFIAENDPGRLLSVHCRWFHAGETEMINFLRNDPQNFRLRISQIPFHCCHALDVMLLYGGPVKRVTAKGIKQIDRPYPSPDEVTATLEFENGAIGSFQYSSVAYKHEIAYVVHAENYTLSFDGLEIFRRPPLRSLREADGRDCRPVYMKHVGPETRTYHNEGTPDHLIMGDFLESVRTGAPMTVGMQQACAVADLAEAIERSWQEDQPIDLPLEEDAAAR